MPKLRPIYDLSQLAEILQCTERTASKLVTSGAIDAFRLTPSKAGPWRVTHEALAAFVKAQGGGELTPLHRVEDEEAADE